jgi:transposase InsO family protein
MSKQMVNIRAAIGKPAQYGLSFTVEGDGLILMKHQPEDRGKVVVPESLRAYVLKMHHNIQLAGHQGKNRTLKQVMETFYWPGMKSDVVRWVKACLACRRRKTPRPMRAGIRTLALSMYPNETVAMDIVGPFLKSISGNMWIFTIYDHFTRWPVAIAMPDRLSATIAFIIFKFWICEKGVPNKIVSDQGRELISKGIQQLCLKLGIMKVSSGYNPRGNASVERFHRYLGAALCIVFEKKLPDWDEYLPAILFSYRASVNDTTGYSPFKMETGRDPVLPVQTMFPFLHESVESEEEYVSKISASLNFAFERARELQYTMAERNQLRKPDNQYKPDFQPGDLLLIWEKAAAESRLNRDVRRLEGDEGGKLPGKLRNPWRGPYKMLRWNGERKCVIDRDGKEEEYNVNRLTKQYAWDAEHPDTSGVFMEKKQHASKLPKQKVASMPLTVGRGQPEVGHVIIFPKEIARGHLSPFGVGQILEIRAGGDLKYQWLGNTYYNAHGIFQKGWKNEQEDLGYYGRKLSKNDVAWTGDHTEEPVSVPMLIAWGDDLLTKELKLSARARSLLKIAKKQ